MPNNNHVMDALLSKIYETFTAPTKVIQNDENERRVQVKTSEKPFVCFCAPGIAISSLDFGDLTTQDQVDKCSIFSQLVNSIPEPVGIWQKTDRKVWSLYERAITDVILPKNNLSQEEQDALKNAREFLFAEVTTYDPFTKQSKKEIRPSVYQQAYDKAFTAFASAAQKYNQARITAKTNPTPENVAYWTDNGPILEQQVLNFYSFWGSDGYRDSVKEANGIISSLTGRGPYALYERLRAEYQLAQKKDFSKVTFLPTFAVPPAILGPEFADSWTELSFSHTEISTFASRESTSYGGGAGASFGLWSIGGSAQHENEQTRSTCNTNGLEVIVELIQVPILRGWLDSWIFSSDGWKGGTTIGGPGSVSNGQYPLEGQMPLYPTSMILARNLRVRMDMTSSENKSYHSKTTTEVSVGWGPFSVRGNYSSSYDSESHDFESTAEGLKSNGAQIIAFICDVLPKCPNPNPNYEWPKTIMMADVPFDKMKLMKWLR
jgi:hypothetical protein